VARRRARRGVLTRGPGHVGRARGITRPKLDLGFDLDRDAERQLGHADGTARMATPLGSEDLEDQIAEPVDHARLPVETRRRIHHAEDSRPARDALQVAERPLQAAENRQTREAGGPIGLFGRDLGANLAQRLGERAIGIGRTVARDQRPVARDAHPRNRQHRARRQLQRRGKR
jgi:hypothetical protein